MTEPGVVEPGVTGYVRTRPGTTGHRLVPVTG